MINWTTDYDVKQDFYDLTSKGLDVKEARKELLKKYHIRTLQRYLPPEGKLKKKRVKKSVTLEFSMGLNHMNDVYALLQLGHEECIVVVKDKTVKAVLGK